MRIGLFIDDQDWCNEEEIPCPILITTIFIISG